MFNFKNKKGRKSRRKSRRNIILKLLNPLIHKDYDKLSNIIIDNFTYIIDNNILNDLSLTTNNNIKNYFIYLSKSNNNIDVKLLLSILNNLTVNNDKILINIIENKLFSDDDVLKYYNNFDNNNIFNNNNIFELLISKRPDININYIFKNKYSKSLQEILYYNYSIIENLLKNNKFETILKITNYLKYNSNYNNYKYDKELDNKNIITNFIIPIIEYYKNDIDILLKIADNISNSFYLSDFINIFQNLENKIKHFIYDNFISRCNIGNYCKDTVTKEELNIYIYNKFNYSTSDFNKYDIPVTYKYNKKEYKNKLDTIYNILINLNNINFFDYYITYDDVLNLLSNNKKSYTLNDYIINMSTKISVDDVYFLVKYFKNLKCDKYLKLIDNINFINTNDIKWYGLITDIAKCNSTDVIVALLNKTNLTTEEKKAILLNRYNKNSCEL